MKLRIAPLDPHNATDAQALRTLLQHYASDPMGGGEPLPESVLTALPAQLAAWPGYVGLLTWLGDEAVGLLNAFTGFSTFKGAPLMNVHDIVVHRDWRGRGIAALMFDALETIARQRGCCKLTLEVLSENHGAMAAYRRAGFAPYVLDPAAGTAQLMQKWL